MRERRIVTVTVDELVSTLRDDWTSRKATHLFYERLLDVLSLARVHEACLVTVRNFTTDQVEARATVRGGTISRDYSEVSQ